MNARNEKIIRFTKNIAKSLFVFCCHKCKIWSIITFTLTLMGFLLSIGNDYFAQYDYDISLITKDMFSSKEVVKFEDIKDTSDAINPMICFILDVSGSIKASQPVKMTKEIWNQIDTIRSSGYCTHEGFDFGVTEKSETIEYSRLLQVHLLYTLKKVFVGRQQNNMSVVLFSDNPEEIIQISSAKDVKDAYLQIYKHIFNGKYSNFERLLVFLRNVYINNLGSSDNYKRKECHLVIFSDLLHETNSDDSDIELEKRFRELLLGLSEKSVDVIFHCVNVGPKQNKKSSKGYSLEKLLLEHNIKKLDVDSGIGCSVISKKPIPFHYKNSLFEEELLTSIAFSNKNRKKYLFGINHNLAYYENNKQEYYVINQNDTIHMSNTLNEIEVTPNDSVELLIKGYIPAPYKSPDIIIQDKNKGIRYVIPVAFYKEFPSTGYLLYDCICFLLAMIVLILLIRLIPVDWVKKKKE